MGLRRLRDDQRGGLTVEHVVVGGVVVALTAGLVAVVPDIPVPETVSYQVCRVAAPVTGQVCTPPAGGPGPDPEDPDAPAPDGGDGAGEEQAVAAAFPQPSDCTRSIDTSWDEVVVNFPLPIPRVGGRLGGRYTTEIEERADGRWNVSAEWYGEIAATLSNLRGSGAGGWLGPQGAYERTWTVDTREEAEQIAHEQVRADIEYLKDTLLGLVDSGAASVLSRALTGTPGAVTGEDLDGVRSAVFGWVADGVHLAGDVVDGGAGFVEGAADAFGLGGVFDTAADGIGAAADGIGEIVDLFGGPDESYDPGRPQVHSYEIGGTGGANIQRTLLSQLGIGARPRATGRIWSSTGYETDSASNESTFYLESRGLVISALEGRLQLATDDAARILRETEGPLEGTEEPPLGGTGQLFRVLPGGIPLEVRGGPGLTGLYDIDLGLVFDQDSRTPEYLDVSFSLTSTGDLVWSAGTGLPGIELRDQDGEGGRIDINTRVPLDAVGEWPLAELIEPITEWVRGDPVGPPSLEELYTDDELSDLVEQAIGVTLDALNAPSTVQIYDTDQSYTRGQAGSSILNGTYLGLERDHVLEDALSRQPGGDWSPWEECSG